MAQDFFEHYWDTVRWKEVAREARTVSYREAEPAGSGRSSTIFTYSERISIGEMLVFGMKVLITFMLMALCAVGAFVTVRFVWGALWGVGAAVVALVLAWCACTSWCRE